MATVIENVIVAEQAAVAAGESEERELAAAFGRRIVRLRRRRGWIQSELARRLGVTRQRLAHWERGNNAPPLGALMVLRQELGVTLDELLTGEPPPEAELGDGQKAEARKYIGGLARLLRLSRDPDGAAAPREKKP